MGFEVWGLVLGFRVYGSGGSAAGARGGGVRHGGGDVCDGALEEEEKEGRA